jgi:hypothetical protein
MHDVNSPLGTKRRPFPHTELVGLHERDRLFDVVKGTDKY